MSDVLTITAHGRSYRIHDPGDCITGEILRGGRPYEGKALEAIYSLEITGKAIDVGASFGNHTLWLAAICELEVVAFEPLDVLRLADNVELNPELPITVCPIGLGDRSYRGKVHPAPGHVLGKDFDRDAHTVGIERLDDLEITGVGLIKIDVEGMEPNVLRGARDTIERDRPIMFIEAADREAGKRNRAAIPPGYEHVATFGATPLEQWRPR